MSASSQPQISLHTLSTADGSSTYVSPNITHTLITGVNYPIEVPYRSDEDPESTHIEVSVRPHNGVAMVRERHIEEILRRTLKSVVVGSDTPRTALQVTVQIMGVEEDEELPGGVKGGGQGDGWLDLLVGCVNAGIAACLDGGVRMKGLVGAVLVGVTMDTGNVVISPSVQTRKKCRSLHVFGFNSRGKCILMESQGAFEIEEWEQAEVVARRSVCGNHEVVKQATNGGTNGDLDMDLSAGSDTGIFGVMRKAVEARVTRDERWKE